MKTKRKSGYYWIKWHSLTEWEIGLYDSCYDVWKVVHKSYIDPIEESDLIKIDERIIERICLSG